MITPRKVTKYFILIILFVLLSGLLVHIFALFGVLIAFAYPIWWLFFPRLSVCFLCQTKYNGDICPLCQQVVDKNVSVSPKTLRSVILNSFLILIFSISSVLLVFVESRVLYRLGYPATPRTASFIIPSKGQFKIGEIFPLKIEIQNLENTINAVQADLSYDKEILNVVDISIEDTFATILLQKEFNNEVGYIRITGGLPNPGLVDNQGVLGTVYFKAMKSGINEVEFMPTSLVLANDGRGSNILKSLPSASFLILPERLTVEEEYLQDEQFKTSVLGAESENEQFVLDFSQPNSVLGIEVEANNEDEEFIPSMQNLEDDKEDETLIEWFLHFLGKIDKIIVDFWTAFFDFLASLFRGSD